ncbi:hypothetical protein [Streptomyces sp. NPDC056049]|uniref:hypothetical protein n=1 Tax=Streptomyces sp. NPDC056049 TaxID=3345693 RepID=UPI0035DC90FC
MYYDDLSPDAYRITEDGEVFTEVSSGVRFVTVRDAYRRAMRCIPTGPGPRRGASGLPRSPNEHAIGVIVRHYQPVVSERGPGSFG